MYKRRITIAGLITLFAVASALCVFNFGCDGTWQTPSTQVTPYGFCAWHPTWDPITGTQIAFHSEYLGRHIWIADFSKGCPCTINDIKQITFGETDVYPAWSPCGKKIAFTSYDPSYCLHIWIVDLSDIYNPKQLTDLTGAVHERDPCWSPNGEFIAFSADIGGQYGIYTVPSNILSAPYVKEEMIALNGNDPCWSPDGSKIAYSYGLYPNSDIWEMEVDQTTGKVVSGTLQQVTSNPGTYEASPSWSPGSNMIAFSSNILGNDDIYYCVVPSTTPFTPLTPFDWTAIETPYSLAMEISPAWSPDGKKIAFESNRNYPPSYPTDCRDIWYTGAPH